MDKFWQEFVASFSPSAIAINLFWSAVISSLFGIALKAFSQKPFRKWLFWASIFVLVFVVLTLARPGNAGSIKPRIDELLLGDANPTDKKSPAETAIFSILWSLTIKWRDDSSTTLMPVKFPETLDITMPGKKKAHYVRANDSLVDKTLSPITGGAMVRGLLIWILPKGRTKEDLLVAKQGTISAWDVDGIEHKLDVPWHTMVRNTRMPTEILSYPASGEERASK
jgi:hypothetical protein